MSYPEPRSWLGTATACYSGLGLSGGWAMDFRLIRRQGHDRPVGWL